MLFFLCDLHGKVLTICHIVCATVRAKVISPLLFFGERSHPVLPAQFQQLFTFHLAPGVGFVSFLHAFTLTNSDEYLNEGSEDERANALL